MPENLENFKRFLPLAVIFVVAVSGFLTLGDYLSLETLRANRAALEGIRAAHPVGLGALFILVYVVLVAFALPGAAVASVTGGFLFGLWTGTALNVVAATIGACVIFLAARWGFTALHSDGGQRSRLVDALREDEISVLLLLRLVPVVPFALANLLPALAGVALGRFAWTTALGIIPGAVVYTSLGAGLGAVFDRGEMPDLALLTEPRVLLPLLGLAMLAAVPMVLKRMRRRAGI